MKILVCGGREYNDRTRVFAVLDGIVKEAAPTTPVLVATGHARGADALAAMWAIARGHAFIGYPADWDTHGKAAGPIRNSMMLRIFAPDIVVAFPGGAGTADMVAKSRAAKVEVHEVKP